MGGLRTTAQQKSLVLLIRMAPKSKAYNSHLTPQPANHAFARASTISKQPQPFEPQQKAEYVSLQDISKSFALTRSPRQTSSTGSISDDVDSSGDFMLDCEVSCDSRCSDQDVCSNSDHSEESDHPGAVTHTSEDIDDIAVPGTKAGSSRKRTTRRRETTIALQIETIEDVW